MNVGNLICAAILLIGFLILIFGSVRDIILRKDRFFFIRRPWPPFKPKRKFRYTGWAATLVGVSWLVLKALFWGFFITLFLDQTFQTSIILLFLLVLAAPIGILIQYTAPRTEEAPNPGD
jgi:hypothetical protein